MKKWTPEEVEFLTLNWEHMTVLEIGNKLGRSICSVKRKIIGLNLLKKNHEDTSNKVENYRYTLDTIIEVKGRQKTLELQEIKNRLNQNDKLKVKVKEDRGSKILNVSIIQKTDKLVILQIGKYKESFSYEDFFTGRVAIV